MFRNNDHDIINKHFDLIKKRSEKLISEKNNIEAFLLLAGFLESLLKKYLQDFDDIFTSQLGLYGFVWVPVKAKEVNKKTFGALILMLERFCNDDVLIKKLKLIVNLRNKLVHNLLNEGIEIADRLSPRGILHLRETTLQLINARQSILAHAAFIKFYHVAQLNLIKHTFNASSCGGNITLHQGKDYQIKCEKCNLNIHSSKNNIDIFSHLDKIFAELSNGFPVQT